MYRSSLAASAWLCFLAACQSASDKVVTEKSSIRDQVLSADRKPVHLPLVPITADALGEDDFARVIGMRPAEWVQRLNAFRVRCKIQLQWKDADAVVDEHTWRQAANGDFAVRHFSKGGGSVEWLKVGDKLLVKNQKGEWREKAVRAEQQDEEPESVLASVRDLFALVGGVQLGHAEMKTVQGRSAYTYKVSRLASANHPASAPMNPSPATYASANRGNTGNAAPSRLLGDDVEAGELNGTLSVDKESGVLIAADVRGTLYALPMPAVARTVVLADGQPPLPPATKTSVSVTLAFGVDTIGDSSFAPDLPKFIAEIQRQRPPSMPLSFWEPPQKAKADKEQEEEE